MTYHEAIEIRTAQLAGRPTDPAVTQRAIEVIASGAKFSPASRNYGFTSQERRRIDTWQVRLLEAALEGRP